MRPHLWSPLTVVSPLIMRSNGTDSSVPATGPPGSWVLSNQTIDGSGRVVGQGGGLGPNGDVGLRVSRGGTVSIPGVGTCPGVRAGHALANGAPPASISRTFNACARHFGLREVLAYQPSSRYWPLQWYESAIFLALALLLVGVCFWWLVLRGRRASGGARMTRVDTSLRALGSRAARGHGVERAPSLSSLFAPVPQGRVRLGPPGATSSVP